MRRAALPSDLLVVALLAVLVVALLATATAASPQPSPVCGFCGDRFEDTADEHAVNATVAESTVAIQVHENGSATWTVENRLTNGSDRFRDDPSRLSAVGRAMADSSRGVISEARFISAEMHGDTAVLVYRDVDAAERHAGLLVVDYLHHGGYQRWFVVNAEEFTIRGPAGTVVTNDLKSGSVSGRTVTWTGSTTGEMYEAPSLWDSQFVVFGPDRSAATTVRTAAAVLLASGPVIVRSAQSYLLLPVPVFALALGGVVTVLRRRGPRLGVGPLAALVTVLSGLAGVALAAAHGPGSVPGPAVFGVIVGGLAAHPRTRRSLWTPRRQWLVAAGALVTAWAGLSAVYAAAGAYDDPASVAFRSTALALPFAAMLPLGGALDDGGRRLLGWSGVTVVAFAAVPPVVLNFADPPSGFGAGLAAMAFLLAAVVFPVVGGFAVALGRALSDARPTEQPGDRSARWLLDDV